MLNFRSAMLIMLISTPTFASASMQVIHHIDFVDENTNTSNGENITGQNDSCNDKDCKKN